MKKIIIVFTSLTLTLLTYAQSSCEDSVAHIKDVWTATKNPISVSATEYAQEKKMVDIFYNMIRTAYLPVSLEAKAGGSYPPSPRDRPVSPYSYNLYAFPFYCAKGKIQKEVEWSERLGITVNDFWEAEIWEWRDAQEDDFGFHWLRTFAMPTENNGVWSFPEKKEKGHPIAQIWLITYDGKLPWLYATRKDFLLARQKRLPVLKEMSLKGTKETLSNIEIEKKYKETEYKNDPEKMEKYSKNTYLPMKDNYERILIENAVQYDKAIERVNQLLLKPDAELSKNAIVKMDPHSGLDYLFTEAEEQGGYILVKPNPGYFNTKLPKTVPQMIQVSVQWDYADKVALKFAEDVVKAIDFKLLKSLIGKLPSTVPTKQVQK